MGHGHEHLNSGITEFYTPPDIIEAARTALGGIDLDPASCEEANEVVQAETYYTKEQDGLSLPWIGRVWLNHPFEKGQNDLWIDKLISECLIGTTEAACCITWANVDTSWFRELLAYPQCFPHGRVHYRSPGGVTKKGAPKGSVITYLGSEVDRFAAAFKHIGTIKVPYGNPR